MAARLRPVHTSTRPRTRAPTRQFGRSFNLLRRHAQDHEVVIQKTAEGSKESDPAAKAREAHNTDRSALHPAARHAWAVCPGFARCGPKIPIFCPAVVMRRGLCSPWDRRVGRVNWGDRQMMKASGRAALVVLTGLLLLFGAAAQ